MSVHDPFIERGMALLDEKVPGWERRIDLRRLNLNSCRLCVVGQLFPRYYVGLVVLSADAADCPRAYGFSLNFSLHHAATYGGLTSAWKRAIRRRLAEARP